MTIYSSKKKKLGIYIEKQGGRQNLQQTASRIFWSNSKVDGIFYVWTAIRSTRDNTSACVPGTSCGVEKGTILDTSPPECSGVAASR